MHRVKNQIFLPYQDLDVAVPLVEVRNLLKHKLLKKKTKYFFFLFSKKKYIRNFF